MATARAEFDWRKVRRVLARRPDLAMFDAAAFADEKVKATLNVPAPTVIGSDGEARATTPAIPGAPPRLVSGDLRKSVYFAFGHDQKGNPTSRVGANTAYARFHELASGHAYLRPTVRKYRRGIHTKIKQGLRRVLKQSRISR